MNPIFETIEIVSALVVSFGLGVGGYFLGTWLSRQKPELYERLARSWRYMMVWVTITSGFNLIVDLVRHRSPETHLMILLIFLAFFGGSYSTWRTQSAKRH